MEDSKDQERAESTAPEPEESNPISEQGEGQQTEAEPEPGAEAIPEDEATPERPRTRLPRPGQEEDGGRPWRRISKTLAFWVFFLLVAIFASKFFGSSDGGGEVVLSYKEYKDLLTQGRITSAVIIETEFHGKLLEAEYTTLENGEQRPYQSFVVDLGVIDSETRTEWEKHGVDFRFHSRPFNWLNVFFNFRRPADVK